MQASQSAQKELKSEGNSDSKPAGSTATPAQDTDLPRRFGRLTLLKHLARGGMGEVYLATSGGIEGAERPCVVKIIRREHVEDRSFLARFFDEARIQAQLQHPGVAQIFEASTDGTSKPYVVMEYVEGRNLGEVRHRSTQLGTRVAWPDVVALGVALTEALAHVHERTDAAGRPLDIVHRDLSPQNVMVSYGGDVKLIDFGTARGENRRCHTVAGVVFAKPGYVAPEVANNNPGGAAADLYAIGIMLWELLAGRRFLAGEPSEHLAKVASGERRPTPISQLTEAPAELDSILGMLTAYKIADRYQSAREAMTDLVTLLKGAPSSADGERGVRARIARLVQRLYPAEPARSRVEFARLVAAARKTPAATATPAESPEPAVVGDASMLPGTRYELGRELGRGAMGTVVEGRHVDLGRRVAIKLLAADGSESTELFDRFRAEARAVAGLRHDNLVTLYDFGVATDRRPFYAMELLEGETLDRYLEREKGMDWREAAGLGIQACRALEAAHGAGVVHRDIKPANLFITSDGVLKLLDFGIAKPTKPGAVIEGDPEAIKVFGTPEYMAPEQDEGSADERSDLYSLGCVLYELLTGCLPVIAESTIGLIADKKTQDPESPRRRAPARGIPKMLDKTIQRCLSREPENRYQSAGELRDALEAALREPIERRQRRRRIGVTGVAATLLISLSALVYGIVDPEASARAVAALEPTVSGLADLGRDEVAPAVSEAPAAPAPAVPAALDEGAPTNEGELTADFDADAEEPDGDAALADEADADESDAESVADAEQTADAASPDDEAAVPEADSEQDEIGKALAEAQALIEQNRQIKAYNVLRRLGREHPQDARVLEAWSKAAAATKRWGDAYKVAWRWAELDDGVAAQLHLAQMQRRIGKRSDAVRTLKKVLAKNPDCPEAREMLGVLSPRALVAMSEQ
jgi:serine/threonine protein kinase